MKEQVTLIIEDQARQIAALRARLATEREMNDTTTTTTTTNRTPECDRQ